MINLTINFIGNNTKCIAEVELDGIKDSWTAQAKITGHPSINNLNIFYRLSDFLRPLFILKSDLEFFKPLLKKIQEHAEIHLNKEFKEIYNENGVI